MNNWPEIYREFEETPEMVAFREWCFKNGFEDSGLLNSFHKSNIKMIFGLLQCFAETKGWEIASDVESIELWQKQENGMYKMILYNYDLEKKEDLMLWCATKYFEITND